MNVSLDSGSGGQQLQQRPSSTASARNAALKREAARAARKERARAAAYRVPAATFDA